MGTLEDMIELVSSQDNIDDIMYNAYDKMKEKLWYLLPDLPWTNLSIPEYRSDDYSLEPEDTSLYAAEKQDILNF